MKIAHPALKFDGSSQIEEYVSGRQPDWLNRYEVAVEDFRSLIDQKVAEAQIQTFLEMNPFLLPGIGRFHHGPYEGIIVTKLMLGDDFQSDFAYVSCNSQSLCVTGVEIESPRKVLFRKDGSFHRDYVDARQQITDWLFWAHHNVREALDKWHPLFRRIRLREYHIQFRGVLVFGRRTEFEDNRKRHERWAAESKALQSDLCAMTYDRLLDCHAVMYPKMDNDKFAVCSYRDRQFCVKHVCA